jgi:hypothetical protein
MEQKKAEEKEQLRKGHPGEDKLARQMRGQLQCHREEREEGPVSEEIRIKRRMVVSPLRDADVPVDIGGQNLLTQNMGWSSVCCDLGIEMAGIEVRRRFHPSNKEKDNEDKDARENPVKEGCTYTAIGKQAANGTRRGGGDGVVAFHAAGMWLWVRENLLARWLKAASVLQKARVTSSKG